eukprot:scaffold339670_cov318-Cyclotella_meneghiniana.AAC.1
MVLSLDMSKFTIGTALSQPGSKLDKICMGRQMVHMGMIMRTVLTLVTFVFLSGIALKRRGSKLDRILMGKQLMMSPA